MYLIVTATQEVEAGSFAFKTNAITNIFVPGVLGVPEMKSMEFKKMILI